MKEREMTINSVPFGTPFASRKEVSQAGLHAPHMAGIYPAGDGARAESIVISGGYSDDRDYGDVIIYTGAGGQSAPGSGVQIADQKIEGPNKALVRAQLDGTSIRVIRGSGGDPQFSPASGYRYDGLYEVRNHWFTPSQDGPLVVQFELVALDYGVQSLATTPQGVPVPPSGNTSPSRRDRTSSSLVRSQANVDWIKSLYDNTCQVCRIQLRTDAGAISIGAHIQGLGRPYDGPDVVENMLCLCHNCHAIFDSGAFYIKDDCRSVTWLHQPEGGGPSSPSTELFRKPEHQIGLTFIQSHRLHVGGVADNDQ
jgi:putative restriction endonuclease